MTLSPNSYTSRALRSDPQIDFGLWGAAYMTGGAGFNGSLSRIAANASGNPWSSGNSFGSSFMMGGFGTFRSPFSNPFGGYAGIGLGRFSPTTQSYLDGYFSRRPQLAPMGGIASRPLQAPTYGPPSATNIDASTAPPPAHKRAKPLSSSHAPAPAAPLSAKDRDEIIQKLMDNGYSRPEAEAIVIAATTAAKNDGSKVRSLIAGLPKKEIEDGTGNVDPEKREAWLEAFGKWYGTKIANFENDDAVRYANAIAYTHNDSWIELGDSVDVVREGENVYVVAHVEGWEGVPAQTIATAAGSQLYFRYGQWYSKDAAGVYQPVTVANVVAEGDRLFVERSTPILRDDLDDATTYLVELGRDAESFRAGITSATQRQKAVKEKRLAAVAEGVIEMVPHLAVKGEMVGGRPTLSLSVGETDAHLVSEALTVIGTTPADKATFNHLFTELPHGTDVTFNGERVSGFRNDAWTPLSQKAERATPRDVVIPLIDVSAIHGSKDDVKKRIQERVEQEVRSHVRAETKSPNHITIDQIILPPGVFNDVEWEELKGKISGAIAAEHSLGSPTDVVFTDVQNLAHVVEEAATRLAALLPENLRSKISFNYDRSDGVLRIDVLPEHVAAVATAWRSLDSTIAGKFGRIIKEELPPLTSISFMGTPAIVASYVSNPHAEFLEFVTQEVPGPVIIDALDLASTIRHEGETRETYIDRLAQAFVSETEREAGERHLNHVTAYDVRSVVLPRGHVDAKTWEAAWKKAKELFTAKNMANVHIGPARNIAATMLALTTDERTAAATKVKFTPIRDMGRRLQSQYAAYTAAVRRETTDPSEIAERQAQMAEYEELVDQYRTGIRAFDPSLLDIADRAVFDATGRTLQSFDADQAYPGQRQEFLDQLKVVMRDHVAFEQATKTPGATKEALRDRYDILVNQRAVFDRQCRGRYAAQALADVARDKVDDLGTRVQAMYDRLPTHAEIASRAAADQAAAAAFTKKQQDEARAKIAELATEFETAQKRFVDSLATATDEGEVARQLHLLRRDHERTEQAVMAYVNLVLDDAGDAQGKITTLFDQATAAHQSWLAARRTAATARARAGEAVAHVAGLHTEAMAALASCQGDLRSERFDDPDITKLGKTVERYDQAVDQLQAMTDVDAKAKDAAQQARVEFDKGYQAALAFHARRRELLLAWQPLSADHDRFATQAPRATQPTLETDHKSLAERRQQLMTQCQPPGIYADQALAGAVVRDLEGKKVIVDQARADRIAALASAPPTPAPAGPTGPAVRPPPPPPPKPATVDQAQFKLAESTGRRLKVGLDRVRTALREKGVDVAQKELEAQRPEFESYRTALEGLTSTQRGKLSRYSTALRDFDTLGTDITRRAEELKAFRDRATALQRSYTSYVATARTGEVPRRDLLYRYHVLQDEQRALEAELRRRHQAIRETRDILRDLSGIAEGRQAREAYFVVLLDNPVEPLPDDLVTNPRPHRVAGDTILDMTLPDDVKLAFERRLPQMFEASERFLKDRVRTGKIKDEDGDAYADWVYFKWEDARDGRPGTKFRPAYLDALREGLYYRATKWLERETTAWRNGVERRIKRGHDREWTVLREAFAAGQGECSEHAMATRALHEYLKGLSSAPPEVRAAVSSATHHFLQVHDYAFAHVATGSHYPNGKREQWDLAFQQPGVAGLSDVRASHKNARPDTDAAFIGFLMCNRGADLAKDPAKQLEALELYHDAVAYAPQNALIRSEAARFFVQFGEELYRSSPEAREQVLALYQQAEAWLKDIHTAEGYTHYRRRIAGIRQMLAQGQQRAATST